MNTPDSDWADNMICCKVCQGEIPYGHTNTCYIHKMQMLEHSVDEFVKSIESEVPSRAFSDNQILKFQALKHSLKDIPK